MDVSRELESCGVGRLSRTHRARGEGMPWSRMPCRIQPIPFDTVAAVAAGAAFVAATIPQKKCWLEALVVGSNIAQFFRFTGLQVGTDTQQVALGDQECTVYQQDSVNNLMNWKCAKPGMNITLSGVNQGVTPRAFRATGFCVAIDEDC